MRKTRSLLLTGTILPALLLSGPDLVRAGQQDWAGQGPSAGQGDGIVRLAQGGPGEGGPRGEGPRGDGGEGPRGGGGEGPRGGPPGGGARPERGPPE
ncbi:hypothetical protein ABS774_22015, partial [Methylobacterium oxalidis]